MSAPWLAVEGEFVVEASELDSTGGPTTRPCCGQPLGVTDLVPHRTGGEITHWDYTCVPCNKRLVIFND